MFEVERLRAEVERLTKERDEARATQRVYSQRSLALESEFIDQTDTITKQLAIIGEARTLLDITETMRLRDNAYLIEQRAVLRDALTYALNVLDHEAGLRHNDWSLARQFAREALDSTHTRR